MRIPTNCLAGGMDRARSEAVLEQLGARCTAVLLVKIGRDKRKKHQMARVGYNSRRMAEMMPSSLKRLLDEALWTNRDVDMDGILVPTADLPESNVAIHYNGGCFWFKI